MLAAMQSPLLAERKQASVLIPRLCASILQAPHSARHVRPFCPPPGLPVLNHAHGPNLARA